ncbi:MAG: hypothetical protein CMO74_15830 [Verrucomicrobiales bacterium]|nr:hypothetical protein [Verrucomicrobiales bacterium]|tara:strand:- start:2111 stop:3895 length:1785 start_codon:yes stop_codon:yes gene_type:complete
MATFGLMEFILIMGMLNLPAAQEVEPDNPPPAKLEIKRSAEGNSFYEVTKYLDLGGELFVYLSTEQVLAQATGWLKQVDGLVKAMGPMMSKREARDAAIALKVIQSGLRESGLEEISGFGASSIALRPGFHRSVAMLHRYPTDEQPGLIWSLTGRRPHVQDGFKLMPTSTVFAAHGDLDPAGVLRVIEDFVKKNIPPAEAREFERELEQINEELPFNALLKEFGGEMGMTITLNEERKVRVPAPGGEPLEFPEPGLVLAIKTADDTYANLLAGVLAELPKKVEQVSNVTLNIFQVPVELPLDIRPTLFNSQGYLILASNPLIAREILAVQSGRSEGLVGTKEFKALSEGMQLEGNAIHYVSPRFGLAYFELMDEILKRAQQEEALPAPLKKTLDDFFATGRKQMGGYLGIVRTQDDGILYTVHSSQGGAQVAMGAGAFMLGAGVFSVMPALEGARNGARRAQSMNNVKQLALAVHIHADKNGRLPEAANWSDTLLPLLGNNTEVFVAPDVAVATNDNRPPCSYAFNAALGGVKLADIRQPAKTVLFLDLWQGWNGNFKWPFPPPAGKEEYIVGFADGHIERVPFHKLGLFRWKP